MPSHSFSSLRPPSAHKPQGGWHIWLSAFLPPFLWAALIYFLSDQSTLQGFESSVLDFIFKKMAHVTVYAVLFLLIHRAFLLTFPTGFSKNKQVSKHFHWLAPLIFCFIYALTDELHQSLVPGRSPTIRDIGFDMLGVTVAILGKYRYI